MNFQIETTDRVDLYGRSLECQPNLIPRGTRIIGGLSSGVVDACKEASRSGVLIVNGEAGYGRLDALKTEKQKCQLEHFQVEDGGCI